MSAHVLELLSAYLDDELVPADRAAIDLHLRDCAGCARRLEELAAVDTLARALPAEAPEGYFGDFSARVRARVVAPVFARMPRRFPVWTLAAAAALLLAVLTPGLLQKQVATPPAAPAPAVADSFTAAKPAQPQQEGRLASEATPLATLALDAAADKKLARSRGPELQGYDAIEQDRAKERGALAKQAPRDVREEVRALGYVEAPQEKAKAESRADAPTAASRPEPASVEAAAPAAPPTAAGARAQLALRDEASPDKAAAAAEFRGGAFASEAEAKTAPRRQNQAAATPATSPFQELLDRRVSTAAEARSLREGWRAHAVSAPAGEADEARVRAIEAGALAVKLSREPSDLIRLRKDVADYVARADALQASRARAALRGAEAAGR